MTSLERALARASAALTDAGLRWALVGGLAVGARAEPRTTRDVDLAVAVEDDAEAESALFRLQQAGFSVVTVIEQTADRRLATGRLLSMERGIRGIYIDLLFASSGIEREAVNAAEVLEIRPGVAVPVARIGHLLAMKALSRQDRERPQDFDDLRALCREASAEDLAEARRAALTIEERGYSRGRSLLRELNEFLATWSSTRPGAKG